MSSDRTAELEQRLAEMTAAYEAVKTEKNRIAAQYDDLAAKYETLKRKLFGRSSEKQQHDDQPQLFDEFDEAPEDQPEPSEETTTVASHSRKKQGRKPLPDDLEREDVHLDIGEDEKHCGCGHDLVQIGEEISEKLTIIPARFIVTRYIRPKYACHHCEGSGDEDNPAVRIA